MLKETDKDGQQDWYSNKGYQRVLADNLIKFLGYDGAIEACYDHEWMETLNFVKSSTEFRPHFPPIAWKSEDRARKAKSG